MLIPQKQVPQNTALRLLDFTTLICAFSKQALYFALMQIKSIGIHGYGAFGRLMARELSKHFDILVYSPSLKPGSSDRYARYLTVKELAHSSDLLVFALPVQFLEEVAQNLAKQDSVPPHLPLMDVSSVKVYPLEILQKYFPGNPLLGTHPIFGPQSVAKYGLSGSKIVLCNESFDKESYQAIKNFLLKDLKLQVLEKSAQEHDREMAFVQGLSHFLGRALADMQIKDFDSSTFSYKHLIELKELLKDDSWELFKTIQNYNPYAKQVRKDFLDMLKYLNKKLSK